jgi:c-di-GMP-binding flagellar brake protein YcgR
MDSTNLQFKVNQKIELVENNISYKALIQDVNENQILIDMPTSDSKYYTMHVGSELEFFISSPSEVIKYRSRVIGKKIENHIQLVVLNLPQVIGRIQRREYFRMPVLLEAAYTLLAQNTAYTRINDLKQMYSNKMAKAITIDLSGGGVRIVIKESIPSGSMLLLSINIPEEINIICKVIRADRDETDKNYKVALRFENIEERNRDKIISFIFKKLREQSKLLK